MTTPNNDGGEKFFQLGTKAVIVRDSKVLMLKTNPAYSQGKAFWDFPGGRMKQKFGTKPRDIVENIRREVQEETGIATLIVKNLVHTVILPYDVPFNVGNFGLVLFFYKCTLGPEPNIKLDWEHTEFKWFDKKELPDSLDVWYREAIEKTLGS